MVKCQVLEDGTLSTCEPLSENPPGYRYGQAAVRASALYRMSVEGEYRAFIGREIELTISWPAQ